MLLKLYCPKNWKLFAIVLSECGCILICCNEGGVHYSISLLCPRACVKMIFFISMSFCFCWTLEKYQRMSGLQKEARVCACLNYGIVGLLFFKLTADNTDVNQPSASQSHLAIIRGHETLHGDAYFVSNCSRRARANYCLLLYCFLAHWPGSAVSMHIACLKCHSANRWINMS